jgi:hypothetical protein
MRANAWWLGWVVGLFPVTAGGRELAPKPKTVDPVCEHLLPVADAERITAHRPLKLVPRRSLPAAGGTCNYAEGGTRMVLLFTLLDGKSKAHEQYLRYRGQPAYQPNQKELSGLGDEGFTAGAYEHQLVARKGKTVVMLAAMIHYDKTTHTGHASVTRDQLITLAREVVGKR